MKSGKTKKNTAAPLPTDNQKSVPQKAASAAPKKTAAKAAESSPQPPAPKPGGVARKSPAPKPAKAEKAPVTSRLKRAAAAVTKVFTPKAVQPASAQEPAITPVEVTPAPAPIAVASAPAPVSPSIPGPPENPPRRVRQPRPVPVEIPAILLEPDHLPSEPAVVGPGARFALRPDSERGPAPAASSDELPEAYGTEQIFLAARDPYCLFASWDLNSKQRARYNAESASGALTVRLRRGFVDGPIHLEVHTLPLARDWFIEVKQPDTTFVAELGYHEKNSGAWRTISTSKPATTPRDRVAPMPIPPPAPVAHTEFPTHPAPAPALPAPREEIIFATPAPAPETHWIAKEQPEPIRERPQFDPEPPKTKPRWKAPKPSPPPRWTESQAKALDELISLEFRRMQQGSAEIEELLKRRILRPAEGQSQPGLPSSIELQEEEFIAQALGLTQPGGPSSLEAAPAAQHRKGFWFKVNAELIIYGSTEPDAHVSIGGRPIRLRADGSFSYRFALPDGAYELPIIALSRDGDDGRGAELGFSRATQYSGDVPPHPQDPALQTPSTANL